METERRRIFFGIHLSPELRKRLVRIMSEWPESALILTREENLHVTLYYLGFVAEDEIMGISDSMRDITEFQEGFEMTFTSIEAVPDPAQPKMIYLSGKPNEALLEFQERVEKVFSPYLAAKKSYRPHATLAKVRKAQWMKLAEPLGLPRAVNFVEFVDALTLFESVTIEGKRQYVAIDTFPFK